jgi:D-alanyl-D-alanine carboxypeptidase
MPFLKFMDAKVFAPLGMQGIVDVDQNHLADTDPTGYMRYALGPPRVAPKEGKGWLFAAGELAMSPQELAKWDIAMLDQKLLKPSSYKELETDVKLKNGQETHYGLGIGVQTESGHRVLSHGGEVSGFVSQNMIFPDDRAAVVVLTNQDASTAAGQIARKIAPLLFASAAASPAKEQQQDRKIFDDLQHGKIDRSLFTSNANSYFTDQAVSDYATSLAPLGVPEEFTLAEKEGRGGMMFKRYTVKFPQKTLSVTIYEMPDGKIEQYLVSAQN